MEEIKIRKSSNVKTLDVVVEETTRSYICEVLEKHSGNVAAAANALGLSRQGLYKKMKRLGIDWNQ
jgi:transcriptional regulator with PAS, ATPase and Fis domain